MKTRLTAREMIFMAERLLTGAIEQVLEEVGSPPFPKIDEVANIRDTLHGYIHYNMRFVCNHESEIFREDDPERKNLCDF